MRLGDDFAGETAQCAGTGSPGCHKSERKDPGLDRTGVRSRGEDCDVWPSPDAAKWMSIDVDGGSTVVDDEAKLTEDPDVVAMSASLLLVTSPADALNSEDDKTMTRSPTSGERDGGPGAMIGLISAGPPPAESRRLS
jgi:hypothetical protein